MENELAVIFSDSWVWLVSICIGLLLVILELLLGVDTGLDMVFIGSAFILGGLITWPFHNWLLTIIIAIILCVVYIALGRRYVHRWTAVKKSKTNVDTIIGKTGIVTQSIIRNTDGRVRVGNEDWKAKAEMEIEQGNEIVVTGINGVTLTVEKIKEVKRI